MTRAQRIERIMVELLATTRLRGETSTITLFELDRAYENAATIVDYVDDKARDFEAPSELPGEESSK